MGKTKEQKNGKAIVPNSLIYIILIIFAVIVSLQSCLSPINASNGYFSTDVAVWTNIAKKMSQGQIMYVDFFDHKGPALYFLYYIFYLLGKNLGIWILELMCNIANVFIIYKTSKLLLNDKNKSLIVTAICMCFFSYICNENPCTESIALPFILLAFYQFTKFIINSKEFKIKESLLTGISLAIVLLLRPNLATLWVVYYIYILIKLIKQKEIKHLLQIIAWSIIGVAIIFLPMMVYLIVNGALTDFINTYLIFNLKYMSNKESSMVYIIFYFIVNTNYTIAFIFIIYLALIFLKRELDGTENEMLKVSFIYFIVTFYLIIIPQRDYLHYIIPIVPALIMPLIILWRRMKINKKTNIILMVIFLLYALMITLGTKIKMDNYAENKINKEISEEVKNITDKEDNVLVLGNDTSIYLMSDRQYRGKYLYQIPIANTNEDIAKDVIKEIKNDLPDVIVNTIDDDEKYSNYFNNEIEKILNESYIKQSDKIYVKK